MKKFDLEDMEINIKDWLCYVCAKWRSIIATMLIFALLVGGYSYVKPSVESAEQQLSADMLRLLDYYRLQDSHQQYLQESPLMQMDENNVNCMTLKYYISLEEDSATDIAPATYMVNALVESYENEIRDVALYTEIAEKSNQAISATYVHELIFINEDREEDVLTTQDFQLIYKKQSAMSLSGVLSVTIKGYNETFCQMVADCINDRMIKLTEDLSEKIVAHTLQFLSSSNVVMYDEELLEKRYEMLSKAQTISTNITNIEKTLTDAEKDYVEEIRSGEVELENALEEQKANLENVKQMSKDVAQSSVNLKYVLIGLVAGALLAAGFWTMKYVMSGKLRTADDLESMWDVKTYTRKPLDKKLFCIDKMVYDIKTSGIHMFKNEELIEVLKAEIQILADKQGLRKLFITGTYLSDADRELAENLKMELTDTDILLTVGNNVLYNPASLALLADADAVLLCEQLGASSYIEISKELQACADKDVSIIGCVVSEVQ